jgi:hypothetical protein
MRTYFFRLSWLAVLLVFCLSAAVCAQETVSGPVMVIEEPSFDFKEVKADVAVEHSFRVLNKGDKVLEIKKVKPS